mmetsp:Transcript_56145/g.149845  ORF Transcript_56145/g.149845 Transcript_56145/m.149845 type:complete len:217 (+) Transcript_56145:420-1070(+)
MGSVAAVQRARTRSLLGSRSTGKLRHAPHHSEVGGCGTESRAFNLHTLLRGISLDLPDGDLRPRARRDLFDDEPAFANDSADEPRGNCETEQGRLNTRKVRHDGVRCGHQHIVGFLRSIEADIGNIIGIDVVMIQIMKTLLEVLGVLVLGKVISTIIKWRWRYDSSQFRSRLLALDTKSLTRALQYPTLTFSWTSHSLALELLNGRHRTTAGKRHG